MRSAFFEWFDGMTAQLTGSEQLTCHLSAESSNFIRFNHGLIRQPGTVSQRNCTVRLIRGKRQASIDVSLTGASEEDLRRGTAALATLRGWIDHVPEDPFLCQPESPQSTERLAENHLPEPEQMIEDIVAHSKGDDLVGILATGSVARGFASSSGQKNWFTAHPFSLDWCQYHHGDKAAKSTYSGFVWDREALATKMVSARRKLDIMSKPTRKVEPGAYRAYLTPAAISELVGLCAWGGFSAQSTQIGMSPLLHLANGDKQFDPRVSISENIADGVSEDFQESGFTRPGRLSLIEGGKLVNTLCSPRTAAEYKLDSNGASGAESPCSLDMAGGDIPQEEALKHLDTGLYVSNLWYLNFSDRAAGRMTGMTRFTTVWVENGQPVAPVDPMRFDETIYRALGENLIGLTKEREFDLSTSTYHQRSTSSARVPGAVIDNFMFTL